MYNPLSLKAFRDWCARKPADEKYDWEDGNNCPCAQYQKFLGIYKEAWTGNEKLVRLSDAANLNVRSRTFGVLTQHLNFLIGDEK